MQRGCNEQFRLFGRRLHLSAPLAITQDGDDDIKRVEGGLEGDVLVEIENASDDIDDYPDEPLLEILARQGPDAHKAEGRSEAVGKGYARIGAGDEEGVEGCPDGECGYSPNGSQSQGEVSHR